MGTSTPYQTWPPAKRSVDKDGKQKIVVAPHYAHPFGVKWADRLSLAAVPPAICAAGYAATQVNTEEPIAAYVALAASPAIAFVATRFWLYDLFKRTCKISFTADEIVVRGWVRDQRYDGKLQHKFVLYPHKYTKREEERIAHRQAQVKRRWWRPTPKRYYAKSWHVALDYMGQRIDLMTVYERDKAQAVCAKLNLCSAGVDVSETIAPEEVLTPRADWEPQSGDLHPMSD